MKMKLPEAVKQIIKNLNDNGFSAYAVGGCVRDTLLGISPCDWDICTQASPRDIKKFFNKTIDTGIQHGTVSIFYNGSIFEITTMRRDGIYRDNRRPESVTFTSSIEEDLARRDFTVNAIAYNDEDGLIDPFGGITDIENKIIRCVGNPDRRFQEDALRMLRAVRFSAQKNFTIDSKTCCSIRKNAPLIQNLSAERIIAEFTKILISNHPEKVKILYEFGLLRYIMPEMCNCFETPQNIKWHIYDVGTHSLAAASFMGQKPYLRYSALMHDWGKPLTKGTNPDGSDSFRNHAKQSVCLAENFMNRYKFSNADKDKILRLIRYHDREIIPEKKYIKRALNDVGEDIFIDLLNLKRADAKAQNLSLTKPRLLIYDKIEQLYFEIKDNQETFSLKNLDINGRDLIKEGYRGKEIGNALSFLLNHVIAHPEDNQKNIMLMLLKKRKQNDKNG